MKKAVVSVLYFVASVSLVSPAMADGELPDDEDVGEAIPGAEELP